MVNIIVDFEKEYIGAIAYQGESNKSALLFDIPSSFVDYDFVNAEFEIPDETKVVKSNLHPINNLLSVPITQDITAKAGVVSIQLVCYDSENFVIAKSPVILSHVQDSVDGCEIPSAIEQAVELAHRHDNKALLDTITEEMLESPDWNENDTTKKSFVKNRTHWSEDKQVTTDYTVEWLGTTPTYQAQPWAADDLGVTLNECETYTLQAAGATITDVCQKFTMTDQGLTQDYYYIGNLHIFDPSVEDNGFPMLLVMDKMWQSGEVIRTRNIVLTYDTLFGNDLSFSLGKSETVYHPLAMDYMPDGVLDGFSTTEAYPFTFLKYDGHTISQHQLNIVEPTTQSNDYTVPWLKPNVWHRFGNADSPVRSISILELETVDNSVAEEYLIEFWTDDATSSVWLPVVEWVDELTIEANKHYQISIVNNVSLWCAVDVEVEEP